MTQSTRVEASFPDQSREASYEQERDVERAVAPLYDAAYENVYWESERRAFARGVAKHARKSGIEPAEATVLEIGTGTGLLIPHLRAAGFERIVGNDISEDMLDQARAKFPDLQFHLGPIEEQRSLPTPIDVVVGFSVLHHLPDLRSFFGWLSGVLRPGGVFAFADGNAASVIAHERWRWLVWAGVYPLQKPLRILNKRKLLEVPSMEGAEYYSDVHRALSRAEVLDALPNMLEAKLSTHGLVAPSFNNAIVSGSLESGLMRALRGVDRLLPFQGEELWTFGLRRPVPEPASAN